MRVLKTADTGSSLIPSPFSYRISPAKTLMLVTMKEGEAHERNHHGRIVAS